MEKEKKSCSIFSGVFLTPQNASASFPLDLDAHQVQDETEVLKKPSAPQTLVQPSAPQTLECHFYVPIIMI